MTKGYRLGMTMIAIGIAGLGLGYLLAQMTPHPGPSGESEAASPSVEEVEARVRRTLAGADRFERLAKLGPLLRGLGPEAVPEVTRAFDGAPLDRGDPELIALALWWASFDPKAAYAWTARDWRGSDAAVLGTIFRTWAAREPEAAWAAAQTISFGPHREFCADSVLLGWDESGRPGLFEFVRRLRPPALQQRAAEILARRRVIALGAQGALAWLNALPEGGFRTLITPRIASAVTIADPSAAAKWAEPRIASAKRPTGLPRRIATRWILRDVDAAMTWLASLPAGNDRDDGVTWAFRDLQRRNPLTAHAWIARTAMERWNEPAFGVYARESIAQSDPKRALEIVGRITDEELRNYLTTVIARAWLERDREAADAWIRNADLPEDVRKRTYMVPRQRPASGAAPEPGITRSPSEGPNRSPD